MGIEQFVLCARRTTKVTDRGPTSFGGSNFEGIEDFLSPPILFLLFLGPSPPFFFRVFFVNPTRSSRKLGGGTFGITFGSELIKGI